MSRTTKAALVRAQQKAAIMAAVTEAAAQGFAKPYDVATFITVELDRQGFRIVSKPNREGA